MSLELPSNEVLLSQLKWRYAVKKFDPTRKISDDDWRALEEALILAPTSYGLQPFKFLVVTDQEKKNAIQQHAWNQTQVADCSHLVVIAGKQHLTTNDIERYLARVVEVRNVTRESQNDYARVLYSFTQKLHETEELGAWTAKQCYIALGFLMLAAALRGIDTCPMEGFIPAGVDDVLGLKNQDLTSVVLCPLGYRAANDWLGALPKVRLPKDELVQYF